MSEEEKQRYYQLAVQVPSVSSPVHNMYNKWHETQRVLCNLQENVRMNIILSCCISFTMFTVQCEWAERFGVHVMYIVCHYVGGTKCGRDFSSSNPHLASSFLISTKPGITLAHV